MLQSMHKVKQSKQQDFESSILSGELGSVNKEIRAQNEEEDEDSLYCRSLIPILRSLPERQNHLAKIKISQLLFDKEFDD